MPSLFKPSRSLPSITCGFVLDLSICTYLYFIYVSLNDIVLLGYSLDLGYFPFICSIRGLTDAIFSLDVGS